MDEEYESVLFVAREAFVYKVPPRQSNAGYRAAEWGDMEAFLWKGRLRIIERGHGDKESKCEIRLEDSNSGELFALSPYDLSGRSVEPVLDSSRYFVLTVEDVTTKRKAYIGMGFQDRSESFDFNVALQDWTKRQKQALAPPSPTSNGASKASPHIPSGPKKDFSLKEGERISISLPGRKNAGTGGAGGARTTGSLMGGGVGEGAPLPLLPPPPSSGSSRRK